MPQHDDDVSLCQMLDHAREAADLVKDRVRGPRPGSRAESRSRSVCQILGEAASRVSKQRRQHPEVPGRKLSLFATA